MPDSTPPRSPLTDDLTPEPAAGGGGAGLQPSPVGRYAALSDYTPDWDYRIAPDGRYRYVSPACEPICGHPPEDFLADPGLMERLVLPEDREMWRAHLREVLDPNAGSAHQQHSAMELRVIDAHGQLRWIEHRCEPAWDAEGRFDGRRGINHDITRLKDAEAALARANHLYATLGAFNQVLLRAESSTVLLQELCRIVVEVGGLRGCIASLRAGDNGAWQPGAYAGVSPELAATMPRIAADNARPALAETLILTEGETGGERRAADPSAQWRAWAAAQGIGACYHEPMLRGGEMLGVVTFLAARPEDLEPALLELLRALTRDLVFGLTHLEQRERERYHLDALRRSEGHLRALVQATPVGVGVVRNWVMEEVNDFLCQMTGYARDDLTGSSLRLLFPSHGELRAALRALERRQEAVANTRVDTVLVHRDGRLMDVILSLAAMEDPYPGRGMVFTVLDVSAARAAQALLEARIELAAAADDGGLEALLDQALEAAQGLTRSRYARVALLAEGVERSHGAPPGGWDRDPGGPAGAPLGGWTESRGLRGAFVRNALGAADAHGAISGASRALVVPVVRGGALVAVMELAGKPADYTAEDLERVAQLSGMAMDAAEGMRTDQALLRANQDLLEAQDLARLGHWRLEVATGRFEWSRQIYRIFGRDPESPPPDLGEHQEILHPEHRERFEAMLLRAIDCGESDDGDLCVLRPDGSERHIHVVCHPERGTDGGVTQLYGTAQDITERKLGEQALNEARARLGLALEGGGLGLYDADLERGTVRLEGAAAAMLGLADSEAGVRLHDWRARIHPEDRERLAASPTPATEGAESLLEQEYRVRAGEGWLWVLDRARVYARDAAGRPRAIAGTLMEITARKAAEERLRQAARVFESTTEGVMVTDLEGAIVAVNRAFSSITGYDEAEVLGRNPRLLQSGRHDREFYLGLWRALHERGQWRGEVWNRRKNGEVFPEWLTISAVTDAAGATSHYVAVFSDITAIKQSQEKLDFLAHHDALTGLPNRLLLNDRLEHAVARARREAGSLALLFLDLDGFKGVNDTLGHAVGDRLLVAVAERMRARLRASDTLARLGGDEFLVLIEAEPQPSDAATVAGALLALLGAPFTIGDHELYISASIGVSFHPADGADGGTLLRNADLAMYRAKAAGRNTFQFYTPEMTDRARERHALENALRGALKRGELSVHFQPQVEIASGALVGMEALARWMHPRLGLVSPARFIPVAEEIGIVAEIGDWVLEQACAQLAAWRARGLLVPVMSVNVSVQQLERDSLTEALGRVLSRNALAPGDLELEVTESMLMAGSRRSQRAMTEISRLGVRLAVDDFGTGYSSLGRLSRMPIDRLKIDGSFVRDIGRDGKDEAIARAIIGLGQDLGLEVVAEGVERPEQAAFLDREGCRYAQGYLFGRPAAPQALEEALRSVRGGAA